MDQREVRLERLRSPEIRNLIDQGWTTAVFSCGAVEQHGPHMPLFMDAEHGTFLAIAVARRLKKSLVAPTIRIGCSDHHMAFAGTLTLRKSTFRAIVSDYVSSLVHHGFKRIFILPTHGGNFAPLAELLPELREQAGEVAVDAFTDMVGLMNTWRGIVQNLSGLGDRVGGHADIAETSVMRYMHEDLVRMDLAEAGFSTEISEEIIARIIKEGFHTVTPNGIIGDARGATATMGRALVDELAQHVLNYFQLRLNKS